ncbi:MAG: beta-galactosidase trimerization domain-containing protein, partial [Paludibacter sp.]
APHMASMALSQMRGAKQAPFWVTEAQIGRTAGNQRKIVEPGTVRLWSLQEMAQGAAGISFFSFRTFPAGHEHVMVGVLDDDNVPRRRFFEAQQVATELAQLKRITGQTLPFSQVAVIRDFKNDWAFEDGRFAMDFRYMREVFKYYRSLRNASITTNIISSNDNFDTYKLIVVPSMVLINNDVVNRLKTAVKNGATVLITCMTGLRNDDVKSFGRILNASVEELAGIEMEEQHALIGTETTKLKLVNDTATYTCGLWHDVFNLKTATAIGNYDSRFFKGKPVLTKNVYGRGTIYYVGSVVDENAASKMVNLALNSSKIKPLVVSKNELVEVTEVAGEKGKFVYVINYSKENQFVTFNAVMTDILTKESFSTSATIKPMDFRVFAIK